MKKTSTFGLPCPAPADNIYTLESWLKRKFEGMKEAVDGLFKEVRAACLFLCWLQRHTNTLPLGFPTEKSKEQRMGFFGCPLSFQVQTRIGFPWYLPCPSVQPP